jgi:hypothetical protein
MGTLHIDRQTDRHTHTHTHRKEKDGGRETERGE